MFRVARPSRGSRRAFRHGAVITAAVCGIALLGVRPASAQNGPPYAPGRWTVTPSVIIGTGGDLDSTGAGFGLAAGYALGPRWAWEAAFNTLPSVDQGALLTVNSNIWNVTGNMLYYFTGDRRFSPYVAGGLGFGHGSADIPANLQGLSLNDSSTNFIVDLGGGISKTLTDRINVRGDLRYFIGSDLVPDYWRIGFGVGFDVGRH
jgi:opacity protein-like surface antigen